MERRQPVVKNAPLRCPYCHEAVPPELAVVGPDCLARQHPECWDAHGSCATCSVRLSLYGSE